PSTRRSHAAPQRRGQIPATSLGLLVAASRKPCPISTAASLVESVRPTAGQSSAATFGPGLPLAVGSSVHQPNRSVGNRRTLPKERPQETVGDTTGAGRGRGVLVLTLDFAFRPTRPGPAFTGSAAGDGSRDERPAAMALGASR